MTLREHSSGAVTLEHVISICAPDGDVRSLAEEARGSAAALLAGAAAVGIAPIRYDEGGYPPLLRAIPDPPPVLWMRGSQEALSRPAVAVVYDLEGRLVAAADQLDQAVIRPRGEEPPRSCHHGNPARPWECARLHASIIA